MPIKVPGTELTGGDGLLLDGQTLTEVRQWDGEVLRIAMNKTLTAGKVTARFRDPAIRARLEADAASVIGKDRIREVAATLGGYKVVAMRAKAPAQTLAQYDEEIVKDLKLPTVNSRPVSSVVQTISE